MKELLERLEEAWVKSTKLLLGRPIQGLMSYRDWLLEGVDIHGEVALPSSSW